ncbi:MAG: ABC transporter substrate-binding protein, partial [Beijerinckiaceae bacterium]
MSDRYNPSRRTVIAGAAASAGAALIASPSVILAQTPDVIRFGHLTPRTGFLGPLGEYAVMAADLAVEELNAAGGVLGRKLEILKEDSVNPQTASTKAERMVERDKVAAIIGEISSAACLTIAQVAQRTKTLYINTGGNSDALRGSNCNKYMFHVESQNSMYVKTCGRSLMAQGLVQGKKWFSLTADYAFGHDLLKVAKRFMEGAGGQFAADKLVPTDLTDFSAMLLEIRNARPDLVVCNLAGNQITNFLKQYSEFGLQFPVGGFGFDTALAWAAGKDNFIGTWPVVWHHLIDTP